MATFASLLSTLPDPNNPIGEGGQSGGTDGPGFKSINCVGKADEFAVADEVMKGGMLMACHHGLTEEHLQHIHDSMKVFFSDYQ